MGQGGTGFYRFAEKDPLRYEWRLGGCPGWKLLRVKVFSGKLDRVGQAFL